MDTTPYPFQFRHHCIGLLFQSRGGRDTSASCPALGRTRAAVTLPRRSRSWWVSLAAQIATKNSPDDESSPIGDTPLVGGFTAALYWIPTL